MSNTPAGFRWVISGPKSVESSGGRSNDVIEGQVKQDVMVADVLDPDELLHVFQVELELDGVVGLVGADELCLEVVFRQEHLQRDKVLVQVRQSEVDAAPFLQKHAKEMIR